MGSAPSARDYDGWVSLLRRSSQVRVRARHHLLASGSPAVPAIRRGLSHPSAVVRRACVNLLDQLVDDGSVPALVAALEDPDGAVRGRALHALACDTCTQGSCRPGEDLWVPVAIEFLQSHDPDLRAAAIDALSKVAHHRSDAADAVVTAASHDPDRGLRGMASRTADRLHRPRS